MHNMIEYDEQRYNDFLLRQQIFSDWRYEFFIPFEEEFYRRITAYSENDDKEDMKNDGNIPKNNEISRNKKRLQNTSESIISQFN